MSRDLQAEAVANLSMKGYGEQRIASTLNIPVKEVRRLIKQEFVVPPSSLGSAFRPPAINAEIPADTVDDMVAMYQAGHTPRSIADTLETTTNTVLCHLRKRGIDHEPPFRTWDTSDYDYLLEHVNDPWHMTAEVLGRSYQQVKHRYCMLRRMGFNIPQRRSTYAPGTL